MTPTKLAAYVASPSRLDEPFREADAQKLARSHSHKQVQSTICDDLQVLAARRPITRSLSDMGAQRMPLRQDVLPRCTFDRHAERLTGPYSLELDVSSASLSVGFSDQATPGCNSVRREALLADYQAAISRPLNIDSALAAIKLRRAAEIYCAKNNLARFMPRLPCTQTTEQRLCELIVKPVDELIAEVLANPSQFSRTELTDIAQRHMLASLEIDVGSYREGIHKAGLYEGLHSVAGRVVSVIAAGMSVGLTEIPVVKEAASTAMKGVKKGIKILAHELPPNMINPALTGTLRSMTDVKQSFERVGGLPVVAPEIDKSPDMGTIVRMAKQHRRQLDEAIGHFSRTYENDPQALGPMVDAFLALHNVVDRQYRRRIGLNRTQTYSKGWGMAVNGVAAVGAVVTATVPVVGQIAGPTILGATIPLQWGAGYLDERRTKHRFNLRANTKWADFLNEGVAHIHFKDLKAEHVSEKALRRSFMTQSEVRVAAIREVYEDELGELIRQHAEVKKDIDTEHSERTAVHALAQKRQYLWDLEDKINMAKLHASHFESFDIDRWRCIPEESLLGKCLDDLKKFEKANRHARLRRPGEGAQIVQRYVQAFHGGVSMGTSLPIIDAITSVDAFYAHDEQGQVTDSLLPVPKAVAVSTGVAGGAVFTAVTGEVRMNKADNKKVMSQLRVSPDSYAAHEEDWVFNAGKRRIDLRTSAGYRQYVHTRRDELALVGEAFKHGLLSGPVGLKNLLRARGQLRKAKAILQSALDALAASGLSRNTPQSVRPPTISAMKDQLYDYEVVRKHLGQ